MNQSMNHTKHHTVAVVRVAHQHWHALEDDCVVGRRTSSNLELVLR